MLIGNALELPEYARDIGSETLVANDPDVRITHDESAPERSDRELTGDRLFAILGETVGRGAGASVTSTSSMADGLANLNSGRSRASTAANARDESYLSRASLIASMNSVRPSEK